MERRALKKILRKGEDALAECRYQDARQIYADLLDSFRLHTPPLLYHAACIYGLVRALHGCEAAQEAIELANSAVELLAIHQELEIAA